MQTTYYPDDNILVIRFSNKPVVRETSQDWHVNVSYAEDGSIVGLVILDAQTIGPIPVHAERRAA